MKDSTAGGDLAPLDPKGDPARWETMVSGINRAAAREIARRAAAPEPGVLVLLSRWRRPAAALYGAIAAAAAAILLLQAPPPQTEAEPGIASELGYPATVADWVEADWSPSVEELVFALEGAE